jgi:hypothetical protein
MIDSRSIDEWFVMCVLKYVWNAEKRSRKRGLDALNAILKEEEKDEEARLFSHNNEVP